LVCWAIRWGIWFESARDPDSHATRDAERSMETWMRTDEELPLADDVLSRGGLRLPKLRRGEWEPALAMATEIERALGNAPPVAIYLLPTYCAMADLYYALARSGFLSANITQRQLRSRLRRMHFRILIPLPSSRCWKPNWLTWQVPKANAAPWKLRHERSFAHWESRTQKSSGSVPQRHQESKAKRIVEVGRKPSGEARHPAACAVPLIMGRYSCTPPTC
jgi:hypothetical protein